MKTIPLSCFLFLAVFFANPITAQFIGNGISATYLQRINDRVGIGTSSPSTKLHVIGGSDAEYNNTGGYIVAGSTSGANVAIDENEIMARSNGTASTLYLNHDGGNLIIQGDVTAAGYKVGIGTLTPSTRLHVVGGSDAEYNNAGGFIVAGSTAGANVAIDDNEIMARSNGAVSPLYLNHDGGNLIILGDNTATAYNVGIGTTTPTQKLHVVGNILIGGDANSLRFNNGQFFKDAVGSTLEIQTHGNLTPDNDCSHNLGSPTLRWSRIYLCNSPVVTAAAQKENSQDLSYGLKEILKLRAVTYTENQKKIGLIAQEVQKVIPEMVSASTITTDELTGKITEEKSVQLGLDYDALLPVIVNAFKEQQAIIMAKDKQLNDLQTQLNDFQTQLNELKRMLITQGLQSRNNSSNENSSKAILQSISPNPFRAKTTIRYFIPDNTGAVAINIVAANGGVMKTYSGLQKGNGQLVINGSELTAGTYIAALVVNGHGVSSRQMILTK